MKTTLILLLTACLAHARPATFEWEANPPADKVTSYRLERWDGAAWVSMGTTLDNPATPEPDAPLQLVVPDFPDAETRVRAFAINIASESLPSDELTVPKRPGPPGKLRIKIAIQRSTDLRDWTEVTSVTEESGALAYYRASIQPVP